VSERKKLINDFTGSRPGIQTESNLSRDIDEDVELIQNLHQGIIANLANAVKNGILIGEVLQNKKKTLKHGQFIPWVESNFIFKRTTAWNYMKMYENRDRLNVQRVEHLRDALKVIGTSAEDPDEIEIEKIDSPVSIYRKFQTGEKLSKPEKEVLRPWLSDQLKTAQNKAKKIKADLENL